MTDRPTKRPYARLELERRFLLERLPAGVDPDDYERLDDLFVAGTHLRLRVLRRPSGDWIVTKLGQKIVDPEVRARLLELDAIGPVFLDAQRSEGRTDAAALEPARVPIVLDDLRSVLEGLASAAKDAPGAAYR